MTKKGKNNVYFHTNPGNGTFYITYAPFADGTASGYMWASLIEICVLLSEKRKKGTHFFAKADAMHIVNLHIFAVHVDDICLKRYRDTIRIDNYVFNSTPQLRIRYEQFENAINMSSRTRRLQLLDKKGPQY